MSVGELHITTNATINNLRSLEGEAFYLGVEKSGAEVGLKSNLKKTQLLAIAPTNLENVLTYIRLGEKKCLTKKAQKY